MESEAESEAALRNAETVCELSSVAADGEVRCILSGRKFGRFDDRPRDGPITALSCVPSMTAMIVLDAGGPSVVMSKYGSMSTSSEVFSEG